MIMNNEGLRGLCIRNNWFTCGSNRQYDKLFEANEQGAPLSVIATIIWVCSEDVERSEVVLGLIDGIDRHNEKLMGYME